MALCNSIKKLHAVGQIGANRDTSHLFYPPLRSPPRFSDQAPAQFRLYPFHKILGTQWRSPPRLISHLLYQRREKRLTQEAGIVPSVLRGKELLSQHRVPLPGHMGPGAGVGILFCPPCDAGADRILLDVSCCRPQVPLLLHDTRMITALPQSPRSPILKVHMIAHETIGQHRGIPFLCILPEERKVPPSILPVEEHLVFVIPPLDYMMGESWCNNPGDSRHERRLAARQELVKENGMCPCLPWDVSLFTSRSGTRSRQVSA